MNIGDIVLIPFPLADLNNKKIRPAIVICVTKDKFKDILVYAISSVVPKILNQNEILLQPDKINNLRAISVAKINRIVTAKYTNILNQLRKLNENSLNNFCEIFKGLIDH